MKVKNKKGREAVPTNESQKLGGGKERTEMKSKIRAESDQKTRPDLH